MRDAVICEPLRTAVGGFGGVFRDVPPAELVALARELSGAAPERLDDLFRHCMALNVAAALGVEELSVSCDWVAAELRRG